jgi:hypothetical protein
MLFWAGILTGGLFTWLAVRIGFYILYAIAYTFLTGQFKVNFPKIFDILFAGLLDFPLGFLVFSFMVLVITVTPLSKNLFISQIISGHPVKLALLYRTQITPSPGIQPGTGH